MCEIHGERSEHHAGTGFRRSFSRLYSDASMRRPWASRRSSMAPGVPNLCTELRPIFFCVKVPPSSSWGWIKLDTWIKLVTFIQSFVVTGFEDLNWYLNHSSDLRSHVVIDWHPRYPGLTSFAPLWAEPTLSGSWKPLTISHLSIFTTVVSQVNTASRCELCIILASI